MSHNFSDSLAMSHAADKLPIWEEMYRQAFPDFEAMTNHRQDGYWQRQGIDRSVILKSSKQILIDEKVRGKNKKTGIAYPDIALEYMSNQERRVPGWVCKPLMADYIAYAIAPLGRGYLLPVVQLQAAWNRHGEAWRKEYKNINAENDDHGRIWHTLSVGVPVPVLFQAIGDCLRVRFTPINIYDDGRPVVR